MNTTQNEPLISQVSINENIMYIASCFDSYQYGNIPVLDFSGNVSANYSAE